jgi:kynureninase
VASHYHAVEGLRILLGAGIEAVREDTLAKGARAIERAEALGMTLRSPAAPARRGAMLVLQVEAADRLCAWLKTEGLYTDSRRGRLLRLAPFVWNAPSDVDRTFDALAHAMETGAHLALAPAAEGGPVT